MFFSMKIFCVIVLVSVQYVKLSVQMMTVQTNVGVIQGPAADDGDYIMFLGIPYAKVDETNPFGPSSPYPKFDSVFQANDDNFVCPQSDDSNTITGTLDCLRLNIYVPDPNSISDKKLPVLVLIHGGGYVNGSFRKRTYGPRFLVRHDIIFVTFNYRVGPYGFMCLHDPNVPGNQGLKDQVLALRWIRDNIQAFGGDVESITVVGESAGARSIDLHLLSPQEKLFNRAIIQSGSALNAGWFPDPDLQAPQKLAAELGFTTNERQKAIKYLSQIEPKLVINASLAIKLTFRLCIEKTFPNVEGFLVEHPLMSDVPKSIDMTIMLGYNSQEMISGYVNKKPEFFETLNVFGDKLLLAFNFDTVYTLIDLKGIVRRFYIGDERMSDDVKLELADFDSDVTYIYSTFRNIDRYLKNGANRLYQYVFSYNGGRNFVKIRNNITVGGASHADERGYLYDVQFLSEEPTVDDQKTIDRMTTMWTNFAKYGDPTPSTSEIIPVKWEPITRGSVYNYLNIDRELKPGRRHYNRRMAFWDLFYQSYGKYEIGYREEKPNSSSIYRLSYILLIVNIVHMIL